jgi:hypothetical protein
VTGRRPSRPGTPLIAQVQEMCPVVHLSGARAACVGLLNPLGSAGRSI